MENIYLPNKLACRIIELEVTTHESEGLNRESILELIQCYTNAVEFYNQKGDEKRNRYYQRKMQDFLQQAAITEVLEQGKKSELTLRKEKTEEEVRRMANQSQAMAKKMMESSNEESKKQEQAIKTNLAQQHQTLQQRLERKRTNSARGIGRPKLTSASFTYGPSSDSKNEPHPKSIFTSEFIDLPPPPVQRGNK